MQHLYMSLNDPQKTGWGVADEMLRFGLMRPMVRSELMIFVFFISLQPLTTARVNSPYREHSDAYEDMNLDSPPVSPPVFAIHVFSLGFRLDLTFRFDLERGHSLHHFNAFNFKAIDEIITSYEFVK